EPYQELVANTAANLQALNSAVSANPAPFLRQVVANELAFAQLLPAQLASFPTNFAAALQSLSTAQPVAVLQGIVNNQIGYAQLINTSLLSANTDFVAGLNA